MPSTSHADPSLKAWRAHWPARAHPARSALENGPAAIQATETCPLQFADSALRLRKTAPAAGRSRRRLRCAVLPSLPEARFVFLASPDLPRRSIPLAKKVDHDEKRTAAYRGQRWNYRECRQAIGRW